MDIIKEKGGYAIIKTDRGYYVVGVDREHGQVTSALPSDMPRDGGLWVARLSTKGVEYVASPRTLAAAMAGLRRVVL